MKLPLFMLCAFALLGLVGARAAEPVNPGATFRDCPQCPLMVVIPPGRFQMGTARAEKDSDEVPQHPISIEASFAVGVYEVTRDEFGRFIAATGRSGGEDCQVHGDPTGWKKSPGANWHDPGFEQTPQHPVVCVSWNDASAYVDWLSHQTGKRYRLLSESQWEYIANADAHAGRQKPLTHDMANYGADQCCGPKVEGKDLWQHTAPVGSFAPSALGVYDIHGNVWEWLEDCYHSSYERAPGNGVARTSDCSHPDRRATRGGSWGDDASLLRPTYRLRGPIDGRYFTLGFRIARDL